MATTTHETEALASRVIESLNRRDRDAFVEILTEDVVLHDPGDAYRGLEAVVAFQWAIFDAFSDLSFAIEAVCADANSVALRYTVAGVHDGGFQGIPPTGREIEMRVMAMMRVEEGEIAEVWLQPDRLGLLQQLGAVELPEP